MDGATPTSGWSLLYAHKLKCEALVEGVVKHTNQLIFGVIWAGSGSPYSRHVHSTRQ